MLLRSSNFEFGDAISAVPLQLEWSLPHWSCKRTSTRFKTTSTGIGYRSSYRKIGPHTIIAVLIPLKAT